MKYDELWILSSLIAMETAVKGSLFDNEPYFNTFPYRQYIQKDNAIDKVSKGKWMLMFFSIMK